MANKQNFRSEVSRMRVHVTELRNGDRLTNDTFNGYGLHVLSKGTVLGEYEISRLFQHQIDYVNIESRPDEQPPGRTLESDLNPKWLPAVQPVYEQSVRETEQLFMKALQNGMIDDEQVEQAFLPFVEQFQMERDIVSILLLANTKDAYTYQHSVQVGMISHYLATWLGYPEKEAARIGKAGFLHDIGKSRIEAEILNKPGRLTEEEFERVKQHTVYGYDIIRSSYIGQDDLAICALQHHERMNGTGYPHGLHGADIHPYAKIIAVADVYSAMISARVYQQKRDLLYVLQELHRMSFEELDAHTTHTFIRHMIPNFIGKRVKLSSGETGIIVMTHPSDFFRPLIRLDDRFVDLSIDRSLEVCEIYL